MTDYYNDIPETRGTSRTKGTFDGLTGRDLEDEIKRAAWIRSLEGENNG